MTLDLRLILLFLMLAATAAAESEPEPKQGGFRFSMYHENDGTVLKPNGRTDRHYTAGHGLSFAFTSPSVEGFANTLPLGAEFDPHRTAVGGVAGQLIYTPDDLERSDRNTADQPYAGYLYFGAFLQRAGAATFDHVQLEMGVIGPAALGKEAQDVIHDLKNDPKAQGWSHQLHNEFAAQLYLRRKWKLDLWRQSEARSWLQVIPGAGGALGTVFRRLDGDVMARIGWNLPDDFGPGRLLDPADATGSHGEFSFYFYARAGGHAVQHNLFLAGNTFDHDHSVSHKPLVGELQLGAVARLPLCDKFALELGYSQTFLTRQFDGQISSDSYMSIHATFACWF